MRCLAARLCRIGALAVLLAATTASRSDAQETVSRIPVIPGLILLSTLQSPDGDRENVVELASVDSSGVRYSWRLLEIWKSGDTLAAAFARHVRANDLAGAPRLDPIFKPNDPEQRPGYTAFSISSAVYQTLRDRGTAPYSVTGVESAGGVFDAVTSAVAGGVIHERVRYKGTLTRVSEQPAPFPLLVDGRRVTVPALHLRGSFAKGPQRREYEFWVLGDSAHPLLLKSVVDGHVFQVTRVNFPFESAGGAVVMADVAGSEGNPPGTGTGAIAPADGAGSGGGTGETGAGSGTAGADMLERQLGTVCRIELPGVYFAFNSARIDPASDRSLGAIARVLARHPDWRLTVEGHTDSIGTTIANQKLSQQRAEVVRARLKERHRVDTHAWSAVGYGPSRPRESNATIEGRARNRRVELAREC
jgi:outer membrane protein OmpA-like peptidoglycan-associated protein